MTAVSEIQLNLLPSTKYLNSAQSQVSYYWRVASVRQSVYRRQCVWSIEIIGKKDMRKGWRSSCLITRELHPHPVTSDSGVKHGADPIADGVRTHFLPEYDGQSMSIMYEFVGMSIFKSFSIRNTADGTSETYRHCLLEPSYIIVL